MTLMLRTVRNARAMVSQGCIKKVTVGQLLYLLGFYDMVQCDSGSCYCVDPVTNVAIPGTKTHRNGIPTCPGMERIGYMINVMLNTASVFSACIQEKAKASEFAHLNVSLPRCTKEGKNRQLSVPKIVYLDTRQVTLSSYNAVAHHAGAWIQLVT